MNRNKQTEVLGGIITAVIGIIYGIVLIIRRLLFRTLPGGELCTVT